MVLDKFSKIIQATGMVLFEDVLKTGNIVVDIWSASSVCTTPVVNLAPHARSHSNLGRGGINISRSNGHNEFRAIPGIFLAPSIGAPRMWHL